MRTKLSERQQRKALELAGCGYNAGDIARKIDSQYHLVRKFLEGSGVEYARKRVRVHTKEDEEKAIALWNEGKMTKDEIEKVVGFDISNVLDDARHDGRAVMRGGGYWSRPINERMEVCEGVNGS